MLRICVALLISLTAAAPAWAGRDTSGADSLRSVDISSVILPPAMLTAVEQVVTMRLAQIDQIAPLPAADSRDALAITARLAALREMNAFVQMTMQGLLDAAEDEDRPLVLEQTRGLMMRYQAAVGRAVSALLDHPLVRADGWFVISHFGEDADRDAALLLNEAVRDPALYARLLPRLRELRQRGETAPYVVHVVSRQAEEIR